MPILNEKYTPETAVLDEEEKWFEYNAEGFTVSDSAERIALIAAAKREPIIRTEKKQMMNTNA